MNMPALGQPAPCAVEAIDSINRTDEHGKKQGWWQLFYPGGELREEGLYLNSRKEGLWREYSTNGVLKSEITFVNGRPNGPARIFYDNGNLKEDGIWKNNRWTGDYCEYYENGCIMRDIRFNSVGKREISRLYDEKNCGALLRVDTAIADVPFNGGYYENGEPKPKKLIACETPPKLSGAHQEQISGTYRLFNDKGLISKEGDFVNGKLINGKTFHYDDGSRLKRIAKYTEGKYTGDMPADTASVKKGCGMLRCIPDSVWNSNKTKKSESSLWYNKIILFSGVMDDRCFITGREYIYDKEGVLIRIAIYKDGRYIGDAVEEER
jgi:antitoxin component YwqK of YwqJK toxin-antitoxin module